jgi:hypothetical protein
MKVEAMLEEGGGGGEAVGGGGKEGGGGEGGGLQGAHRVSLHSMLCTTGHGNAAAEGNACS